jgi:dolichol-phosphate mannosyltransferase
MSASAEISVVIPVYNEEEVIEASYHRITRVMEGLKRPYELVFVNDGSSDASPRILRGICERDRNARALFFSRNFGHQAAISAGLEKARGRAVIVIDADLQDPPEVIPEMIAKWDEGYEVVYGRRARRKGETAFKKGSAALFYRILNAFVDVKIPQDVGDFRLVDRKVRDALVSLKERNRYVRGLVSWLGFRQCAVDYVREPRFAGVTKYPFRKMLKFASDAITSFSNKPLKIASWIGAIVSAGAFVYLLYILYLRLFTDQTVEGWASLMSVILLLNGAVLVFLGLLGSYIGRVFDEVKGRPLYVLSEEIGVDEADQG